MDFEPKERDNDIVLSPIELPKPLNSPSSSTANLANLARMEAEEERRLLNEREGMPALNQELEHNENTN